MGAGNSALGLEYDGQYLNCQVNGNAINCTPTANPTANFNYLRCLQDENGITCGDVKVKCVNNGNGLKCAPFVAAAGLETLEPTITPIAATTPAVATTLDGTPVVTNPNTAAPTLTWIFWAFVLFFLVVLVILAVRNRRVE